jgi:hypothetical protein
MINTTRGTLMIAYDFAFIGPFERQSGVYRKPYRFATRETGEMPRHCQLL